MIDENTSNILMASFNDDEATHVWVKFSLAKQALSRAPKGIWFRFFSFVLIFMYFQKIY